MPDGLSSSSAERHSQRFIIQYCRPSFALTESCRMQDCHTAQASADRRGHLDRAWERIKKHPLARVGPGLITGVADDDPSGIATYSQAGAQFGFAMLWTMPLTFPLMAAVQSMCARIGRVTGKGLAANIKAALPPVVLQGVVFLLLI